MSDQELELETEDEEDLPLSGNARYGFTLGEQFTYRGQTYWPKIYVEDSPLVYVDEEDPEKFSVEDGESLRYRVHEMVHRDMAMAIARTKREVDLRYQADAAARQQSTQ